jgi:hypothetical protein
VQLEQLGELVEDRVGRVVQLQSEELVALPQRGDLVAVQLGQHAHRRGP